LFKLWLARVSSSVHEIESQGHATERDLRREIAELSSRLDEAAMTGAAEHRKADERANAAIHEATELRRRLAALEGDSERMRSSFESQLRSLEAERDTLARRLDSLRDTLAHDRATHAKEIAVLREAQEAQFDSKTVIVGARSVDEAELEKRRREVDAERRVLEARRDELVSVERKAAEAIRRAEDQAERALRKSELAESARRTMQESLESLRRSFRDSQSQVESGKLQIAQLTAMLARR
jgi:chromosome segregation ATPase